MSDCLIDIPLPPVKSNSKKSRKLVSTVYKSEGNTMTTINTYHTTFNTDELKEDWKNNMKIVELCAKYSTTPRIVLLLCGKRKETRLYNNKKILLTIKELLDESMTHKEIIHKINLIGIPLTYYTLKICCEKISTL